MPSWTPYRPTDAAPWNLRRVVHLHRRAVFGATWNEIERDLAEGPEAAVTRLLEGRCRLEGVPDKFERLATVIGNAAVDAGSAARLKAWWLYRCLFSPHPLQERLTLMWHNHFATSNLKVNDLRMMKQQNETFRRHAFSPFGELLYNVVRDPALLEWLDAPSNRKGQPNENLARELMELFTLGIGNYTEDDVQQAARALTGWTVRQTAFSNQPAVHDDGEKTILGNIGKWTGDDLVDMLLEHPATARRIAWRLTGEFCGENVVDDEALDELADGLRPRGLDIRWAVETILRSERFFSDANLGSRVCDPMSFVLAPLRALESWRDPPSTLILAGWTARMGQDLFFPPNVGGWPGGRAWLSTRAVVARANYAAELAEGRLRNPPRPWEPAPVVANHVENHDLPGSIRFLAQLFYGQAEKELVNAVHQQVEETSAPEESLRQIVAALLTRPEAHLH